MPSAQRDIGDVHYNASVIADLFTFEPRSGGDRFFQAEPHGRRSRARGVSDGHRIVGIQYREIACPLSLEKPSLGGGIIFERVMPVEMIGRDVQYGANVRTELADGLELETRNLQHVPLPRARGLHHRGWRYADIPAHLAGDPGFFEDVACERGGRGLPISAGDAD